MCVTCEKQNNSYVNGGSGEDTMVSMNSLALKWEQLGYAVL